MDTSHMTQDEREEREAMEFMDRAAMVALPSVIRIIGAIEDRGEEEDNDDIILGDGFEWADYQFRFHTHHLDIGHICYDVADQMWKARCDKIDGQRRMRNERIKRRNQKLLRDQRKAEGKQAAAKNVDPSFAGWEDM